MPSERTVTTRAYVIWDAETSRRIWNACRQQDAAHNRAVEHLLDHPDEPLRRSTAKGHVGLQGRWLSWRAAREALADIPQAIRRGGVSAAHSRVRAWENTNAVHAEAVVEAAGSGKPIPRRVERRTPTPARLYRRRKDSDRKRRNHCRILEGVRKVDAHTLRVPGIGDLRVQGRLDENVEPRAAVIRERTPAARGRGKLRPEDRSWTIHIHHRTPAPATRDGAASVGVDHGVVHAMTTSDHNGVVAHYSHPQEEIERTATRCRRLERRARTRCRQGSRRRRGLMGRRRRLIGRQQRRNAQRQVEWANGLARHYDAVCVEKLAAANLLRSARGTHEAPGTNVAAKRGLSRRLASVAPARQSRTIEEACRRHGARFVAVAAYQTSITCSACNHVDRKSRESQAAFRCTSCGHEANADANAAENMRLSGVRTIRAGVSRSRARKDTPEAPSSATKPRTGNRLARKGGKETSAAGNAAQPERAAAKAAALEAAPSRAREASRTYCSTSRNYCEN